MTDMDNKMITRIFEFKPFGIEFNSGDTFSYYTYKEFERLDGDFNIFDDTVIPMGDYEWGHNELRYESSDNRPVKVSFGTDWGDYYNGERTYHSASCNIKFNKHFVFSPSMSYNDISIGDDSFKTKQVSTRFLMNLSTRLTSRTLLQWNNASREVNMNFRIHYIPEIGSDVYLVYNQLWDESDEYHTLRNTAVFKVNYLYRL